MQQQEGANVEEADMNEKMRNEIEQLIQKEVARAVFQERLRMQREKQRQEALVREQKKQYSRLGFCFTAFFGITLAVQVGAVGIFTLFAPELVKTLQQTTWFFALLSAAPMYLVAFPAVMALLVLIKPVPPLGGDCFHTQDLVLLGVMGMGVGFGGNILSQVLDFFLSNGSAESAAEEVLMNSNMLLDLAISVFAAPVVEELLFRKCFIDRIGGYGERTAVILSGLLFGLAHGNIQQFFYAFGLGMIWAYVYVRTRNIGYTIAFHMLFNLIGGIFAMSVYQGMMGNEDPFSIVGRVKFFTGIDLTAVWQILCSHLSILYFSMNIVCMAGGIVILICKRRKIHFRQGLREIPDGRIFSAAVLNPGMLAFFAFCAFNFWLTT